MNREKAAESAAAEVPVRELAKWTLGHSEAFADPLASRQAKLLVLDSIACALAALGEPAPRSVSELIEDLGGRPECSVIGDARKNSITNAVLMNGALVRSLDFNDVQFLIKEGKLSVAGHCSDNIPVALAAGERYRSAGADILQAIVMGYELFKRLRDLMPFHSAWDGTSASGLVAAAIAGRLAQLDETRQAHALALAAARCATPSVVRWGKLSGAKNLANSLIAQSGVQSALLAARGVSGPLEVLDHRGGLHQVFDPALGLDTLWAPVTDTPFIMHSHIKPYACIGTAQAAIAAALALHAEVKDRLAEIVHIDVVMADLPMIRKQQGELARRYPKSREAADHSFTFLPAVTMAEGEMTDRQFRDRRWEQADMVRLIEATDLSVDAGLAGRAPDAMPCRIRVRFADGSVAENECLYQPGHSFPERGLDPAVVEAKFRRVARGRLDDIRAGRVRDEVMALGGGRIDGLMALLREAGQ